MEKFAVIGLGRFGQKLARSLTAAEAEVIAIDLNVKLIEQMRDEVALAVRLDGTNKDALHAQGVHEVGTAIVGIGHNFEAAALTVANLKELGVGRIIARAESDIQATILKRVGAHEVAQPENESALRWAHRLALPNLKQYVELGEGHSMVYVKAPDTLLHATLKELDLRNRHGVNLIAIERRITVQSGEGETPVSSLVLEIPSATSRILPDDVLVLVGSNESLRQIPQG